MLLSVVLDVSPKISNGKSNFFNLFFMIVLSDRCLLVSTLEDSLLDDIDFDLESNKSKVMDSELSGIVVVHHTRPYRPQAST